MRAGSESIVRSVGIARLGWDGRGGPEKFVYFILRGELSRIAWTRIGFADAGCRLSWRNL